MTDQAQNQSVEVEPGLKNILGPSVSRPMSAEEQLAAAKQELAELRIKCFGDATICRTESYWIKLANEERPITVSSKTLQETPLSTFLGDLIAAGQVFDLKIRANIQPRGGDNYDRTIAQFLNVTSENIAKIEEAFDRKWGGGYGKPEGPWIIVAYHD